MPRELTTRADASNNPESACFDLHPIAVDKYLIDPQTKFARDTGKRICAGCVVVEECRDIAFKGPYLKGAGIVGGASYEEYRAARAWRNYELGIRETAPSQFPRPDWLPVSEAGHMVESTRSFEELGEAS